MNVKVAVEAICHCLKGGSVAAVRLMGEKFQESSTEESQGCPTVQQTWLPAGTLFRGACKHSQGDTCLGGCGRYFCPQRKAALVLLTLTFRILFPTVCLTPS